MPLVPRVQTITYNDVVAAGSNLTLLSSKITTPFAVLRLRAAFPSGVNRLLKLYYYITNSNDTPTTAPPLGTNLLKAIGQVDYLTGSGDVIEIPHEVISPEGNKYLAVYAVNDDAFEHTIDTQITVEFLNAEELGAE